MNFTAALCFGLRYIRPRKKEADFKECAAYAAALFIWGRCGLENEKGLFFGENRLF